MKTIKLTKPMLFSTPMIKALLDGSKNQTRRIVKHGMDISQMTFAGFREDQVYFKDEKGLWGMKFTTNVGDVIWCRETFNTRDGEFVYKASPELFKQTKWYKEIDRVFKLSSLETPEPENCIKWKPSLFMPKQACRLFLEVTNIRVERLNDISESDAVAEGIINDTPSLPDEDSVWRDYNPPKWEILVKGLASPIDSYKSLWESINGKGSWDINPFVFVYDFKVVERPVNF